MLSHDHTIAAAPRSGPLPPAILARFLAEVWLARRRILMLALALTALVPVFYLFSQTADARRNLIYWDEFDTALALVLKLKEGASPAVFLHDLFGINNEHRMVTSRLLFAGTYWLTGTIDFRLIQVIGNSTIVVACLLLVWAARTGVRRLRLGLLLAFLVFQLEHYENFLWSGASIDHFQVVLLAVASLIVLARGTRVATGVGVALATLATFTLAHGIAIWPVGAMLLLLARRRRELIVWGAIGALAVGGFFVGFRLNRAESFVSFSVEGAQQVAQYWLAILGAVPALGRAHLAPYFGGLLLLVLGYVAARGAIRREPLALAVALFALLAAGLIAIGRAEHSDGQIFSRYYVLSALAWGLAAFMILGRHSHPRRPLQTLVAILPALIFFNAFANREFTDEVDAWITCRDIAAVNFKQHGADGMGPFHLHPRPERATKLLQKAESLGVYRFGAVCLPVPLPSGARTSEQIKYYIEEVATKAGAVSVRGWAAIPEKVSRRGSVHLVLRMGEQTLAFTAVTVPRNDVPTVMKQPGWTNAGFHFARRIDRMPAGDFSIGLLIKDGARAEYVMTGHRVTIPPPARSGLLAAGQ